MPTFSVLEGDKKMVAWDKTRYPISLYNNYVLSIILIHMSLLSEKKSWLQPVQWKL